MFLVETVKSERGPPYSLGRLRSTFCSVLGHEEVAVFVKGKVP